LIHQLDHQVDSALISKTFQFKHVPVKQVIQAIEDVLTANSPTGRGAQKSDQSNNNNGFFYYNPFGNQQNKKTAGAQTAVMIEQTNSVIVSATKENMDLIESLVKTIDQPSIYEGTTFVVHLENAKASDVATLLTTAFTPNKNGQNQGFQYIFYDYPTDDQNKDKVLTDVDEHGNVVNIRDLSGKVTVTADPNTNDLLIVTQPSNMGLIRKIINEIDQIAPQVMIETIIVEANLDKTTKLGVEWNFLQNQVLGSSTTQAAGSQNYGLQSSPTPLQGFKYTLSGTSYSAFLNALETNDRYKILSTPRIFTSNNVKAEIDVSQKVPYIESQQSGLIGNLVSNYSFLPVGVILDVTPRITSSGEVSMDVTQSADDLQGFTSFNAPIVNHRQAQTTVSVKDGETIVLGGIIRTNVTKNASKIPLLGDLPFIGQFFRSDSNETTQTELMVLLTPHIVLNPAAAQRIREQSEKEMSGESRSVVNGAIKQGKVQGGG
jgi:general secretion pathway protein D